MYILGYVITSSFSVSPTKKIEFSIKVMITGGTTVTDGS